MAGSTLRTRNECYSSIFMVLFVCPVIIPQMRCSLQIHSCEAYIFVGTCYVSGILASCSTFWLQNRFNRMPFTYLLILGQSKPKSNWLYKYMLLGIIHVFSYFDAHRGSHFDFPDGFESTLELHFVSKLVLVVISTQIYQGSSALRHYSFITHDVIIHCYSVIRLFTMFNT